MNEPITKNSAPTEAGKQTKLEYNIKELADKTYPILNEMTAEINKLYQKIEKKHKIKISGSLIKIKESGLCAVECKCEFILDFSQSTITKKTNFFRHKSPQKNYGDTPLQITADRREPPRTKI